jgi:hypothetical protein
MSGPRHFGRVASATLTGISGATRSNCDDVRMVPVAHLVTFVDVDEHVADARRISVSARHEAVLVGGRRVLLLDDRGWSESGPPNIWALTSVEDIVGTARMVVGPDEPFGGRSHEDMEADHWAHLVGVLRQQGIVVDALELKRLPHDGVLSERLLARVGMTRPRWQSRLCDHRTLRHLLTKPPKLSQMRRCRGQPTGLVHPGRRQHAPARG